MMTARERASDVRGLAEFWNTPCRIPDQAMDALIAWITAAILAHAGAVREKAAKIAKSEKPEVSHPPTPGEWAYSEGYSQAAENIVAAIRAMKLE